VTEPTAFDRAVMIELYHISKQYQEGQWALLDVNLHVLKGDFWFITGPSGSGKSTLLKIIFREILPTRGQIVVDGINILRLPDHRIYKLRRTMGIVFQDFRLLFHKRVFDNVAIGRVFNSLRLVNLQQKMWEYPSHLSYGEQQRVAIARAVVNEPRILLADEPTGNLDPELAAEIMGVFKEINKQGTSVIICSHDKELIRHFGDKILFLFKGKIIGKEVLPSSKK
jgi:cell division transport system ATP-binding protein